MSTPRQLLTSMKRTSSPVLRAITEPAARALRATGSAIAMPAEPSINPAASAPTNLRMAIKLSRPNPRGVMEAMRV